MIGQGIRKHQKVAKVNKNKVIHEVPQNVVHRSLENLRNQMVSDQMVRVAKVKFGENGVPCSNSKAEDNRGYLFLTVILFSKRKSIQVYTKCLHTFFSTKSNRWTREQWDLKSKLFQSRDSVRGYSWLLCSALGQWYVVKSHTQYLQVCSAPANLSFPGS